MYLSFSWIKYGICYVVHVDIGGLKRGFLEQEKYRKYKCINSYIDSEIFCLIVVTTKGGVAGNADSDRAIITLESLT